MIRKRGSWQAYGLERLTFGFSHMNGLTRDMLHFRNCLTQAVGAGGAAVDQVVVQEAVARFFVAESEDVVYGPGRSGARREIEFYVMFVAGRA